MGGGEGFDADVAGEDDGQFHNQATLYTTNRKIMGYDWI